MFYYKINLEELFAEHKMSTNSYPGVQIMERLMRINQSKCLVSLILWSPKGEKNRNQSWEWGPWTAHHLCWTIPYVCIYWKLPMPLRLWAPGAWISYKSIKACSYHAKAVHALIFTCFQNNCFVIFAIHKVFSRKVLKALLKFKELASVALPILCQKLCVWHFLPFKFATLTSSIRIFFPIWTKMPLGNRFFPSHWNWIIIETI